MLVLDGPCCLVYTRRVPLLACPAVLPYGIPSGRDLSGGGTRSLASVDTGLGFARDKKRPRRSVALQTSCQVLFSAFSVFYHFGQDAGRTSSVFHALASMLDCFVLHAVWSILEAR